MSGTMVPRQLVPLAEQNNKHIAQLFLDFPKIAPTVALVASERITTRYTTVVQDGKAEVMGVTGVYTRPLANQPKLAYDPLTGNPLGIQMDPGYTDFVRQSRNLGVAPWTHVNMDVGAEGELVEALTAEAGEVSASQDVAVNAYLGFASSITNKRMTYTAVVRRKEGTRNVALRLTTPELAVKTAIVDLGTGEVLVTNGLNQNGATNDVWVQQLPDGRFLIRMSVDLIANGGYKVEILMVNGASLAYVGDGVSSVVVEGVQLSDSMGLVPILTTTDSVVSHAPDSYSIALNQDGAVHAVNPLDGTFMIEFFEREERHHWGRSVLLDVGTANTTLFSIYRDADLGYGMEANGNESRNITYETQITTALRRLVVRYSRNKLTVQLDDGSPITLDIGANVLKNTPITHLRLGYRYDQNPACYTSALIRRVFYYPRYLLDAQAAALAHQLSYNDTAE